MLDKLKKDTNNASDIIYKEITINKQIITVIYSEVLTSSDNINKTILGNISFLIEEDLINNKDLFTYLYNIIPGHNRSKVTDYNELVNKLFNGFTIIYLNDNEVFCIETRANLDRGITTVESEISIRGPKDSFTENYNKNLGLIRNRLKSKNLWTKDIIIGKETHTKVSILYMQNIVDSELINRIEKKLNNINIDGILDSGYIKKYLNNTNSIFPTIQTTERPDLTAMAFTFK